MANDEPSANDPSSAPAEQRRLQEDDARQKNWKRWGPYLAERQWGTVREDYSADGDCWNYFTHEDSRSQAYRWGEDGLLGITDRECRLCFALALWNGRDPILKERLFGLTNPEGNHGEDVKECYYYLDSTPTHAYMKALYKYPQAEFPYQRLVDENERRGRDKPEFELTDSGIFDDNRYFDIFAEYAKAGPDDILIRITAANRGPEPARLHLLPTLWFRNTWVWGCKHEGCTLKPRIARLGPAGVVTDHETLGRFRWEAEPSLSAIGGVAPRLIFTDNHTNDKRLYNTPNLTTYVKDAFHDFIIGGQENVLNPKNYGTKVAACYVLDIPAGAEISIRLRLFSEAETPPEIFGPAFDQTFEVRQREADEFYQSVIPASASPAEQLVMRQAYAGLLWSQQFYHMIVKDWLEGDPEMPPPPPERETGRDNDWWQLYSRDILSVPDKWEYPWFAAWDLAFHMLPLARLDPANAKRQLELLQREWYMHPSGQIPAYEYNFSDVNPPVHAWAAWRVYKMTAPCGQRDRLFLERTFHKLLMTFTWWLNRKDLYGRNIFSGGFLGLDNIGVFDRSKPLPGGGQLEQADGTAWMAFFCGTMLSMALELSLEDPAYEDIASKFFEHFVMIADAINHVGGSGLWDDAEGFYCDQVLLDGHKTPIKLRSLVGLIPLLAVEILDQDVIDRLPGFKKRMDWFLHYRSDLARTIAYLESGTCPKGGRQRILAIPNRERLQRVLQAMLDENEFLSPHGIRSLSRVYGSQPYVFRDPYNGDQYTVEYVPGESTSGLFGGNSNWRGPIWFPLNYLLIEALERYHYFYGDQFKVEFPARSGREATLLEVARELERRLVGLFMPDATGRRAVHGTDPRYATDPHWRDLVLFYEYFHAEDGHGLGASHQTGWTALVTRCLEDCAGIGAPPGFRLSFPIQYEQWQCPT